MILAFASELWEKDEGDFYLTIELVSRHSVSVRWDQSSQGRPSKYWWQMIINTTQLLDVPPPPSNNSVGHVSASLGEKSMFGAEYELL